MEMRRLVLYRWVNLPKHHSRVDRSTTPSIDHQIKPLSTPIVTGTVTILCAGTADLSVAEEAAVVAELCGAKVMKLVGWLVG